MAVSKLTTWKGRHRLDRQTYVNNDYTPQGVVYFPSYDVYADMANGNTQPYVRLRGCRFRLLAASNTELRNMLPITVRMQINGTGTTYSFSSGSTISTVSNYLYDLDTSTTYNEYTVTFSSSTNVNIPKNGQTFTFNLTLTTNNGQTITITENACAPLSNTISGASTIYTGQLATYTLGTAVINDSQHRVLSLLDFYFPSWGSTWTRLDAYTSEYCEIGYERNSFTQFKFLPLRNSATIGEKATANTNDHNFIEFYYYYYTLDTEFGTDPGTGGTSGGSSTSTNALLITYITKGVTVVSQSAVDTSLRPTFVGSSHGLSNFDAHVYKYGSAVQSNTEYILRLEYEASDDNPSTQTPYPPYYYMAERLKYGSWFQYYVLRVTIDGVTTTTNGVIGGDALGNVGFTYDAGTLTQTGHYEVSVTLTDSLGLTSSYSESFDVIAYTVPRLAQYTVRRCSLVGGGGADAYLYDGSYYTPDDYGEYALIEWGVSITALNNQNSRSLKIKDPPLIDANSSARTIALSAYICSGYYVTTADVEKSYDVLFTLKDDFNTVVLSYALNTITAIIDFLRGGTGVALGKVAEESETFDIHRNWLLKMPYDTMVQGYNANGTAVRLRDWMTTTANRLQAIIDGRDWGIIDGTTIFDSNTAVCVPSGYGSVYDDGRWNSVSMVPNAGRMAGLMLNNPITVNRNYLNVTFILSASFAGTGWTSVTYTPRVYILSTKPTTINQSTGAPNGTVLTYKQAVVSSSLYQVGSSDDGYQAWERYTNCTINLSSYRGRQIYIVVTCAQGGSSQSGFYTYSNGRVCVNKLMLSDTAAY